MFAELREQILTGNYSPGDRLPTQRSLAADFGVNMASIREALTRLEQLRLIDVRHGDGSRVRDWRLSGGIEVLASATQDPGVMGALLEARRLLLSAAARLAAERRTGEQAERLVALAALFAEAPDAEAALLADWAFMALLVEASGNLVFGLIMNSVREVYLPSASAFARMLGAPQLYEDVAAAIGDGDGDRAAAAAEHLAAEQEQRLIAGDGR